MTVKEFLQRKDTLLGLCFIAVIRILLILEQNMPVFYVPLDGYCRAHYELSYDLAFMPRALIGTLRTFAVEYVHPHTFYFCMFTLQVALCVGLIIFCYHCMKKTDFSTVSMWLFALLLFSPILFFPFWDFGRFDVYLLMIAFVICLLLFNRKKLLASLVILCLFPVGVMIHEVFLFLYAPLMIAWSFYQIEPRKALSYLPVTASVLGSVAAVCILYIMRQNMPSGNEIIVWLTANNNSDIAKAMIPYAGNENEAMSYGTHFSEIWRNFFTWNWSRILTGGCFFLLSSLLPLYIIRQTFIQEKDRFAKCKIFVLAGGSLFPILAGVIAYDFGRWYAASWFCLMLTAFFLLKEKKEMEYPVSPKMKTLLIWSILLQIGAAGSICCYHTLACIIELKLRHLKHLMIWLFT